MSEQIVAAVEAEPVIEPVVVPEPEKDLASELEKWKAMSRKNEARAKENESAARRLAEIEESNKTELERAIARAEAAETAVKERADADERALLVDDVAKTMGVNPKVLRGNTREELEEHAQLIKEEIPAIPTSPGSFASGNVGEPIGAPAQITSVSDLQNMTPEQINEARVAGRLDQLMGKL